MKKAKVIMKVVIIIFMVLIVALVAIYINHRIQLNKEEELKTPLGKIVEVDGHKLSPILKYYRIPKEIMETIKQQICFE